MSTIKLENLTKQFGDLVAVKDVDLEVGAGETLCLLGPSGCGKTTTLRMVAGLETVTAGDVYIAGQRMNDLAPSARDVAMVFQFYALYPALTVGENISYPLHAERISASEKQDRMMRVANILELTHILDRRPGQIAEGEKQRVAVARAIVRDPNCFLFDEPLSRLDVELRQTMRGQIKEVLAGLSKATIIVTHDQLEALTMADRIAVMRAGFVEQVATPHEIFTKPANVFVAGFIGTPQMNLVKCKLLGVDSGKARLKMPGQELSVDVPAKVGELASDSDVTFGIRPRAFTPVSEVSDETVSGAIELIEPMGAETLIHLRDGDQDLRVVVPRDVKAKEGEQLNLLCDPAQVHIFDNNDQAVRA